MKQQQQDKPSKRQTLEKSHLYIKIKKTQNKDPKRTFIITKKRQHFRHNCLPKNVS